MQLFGAPNPAPNPRRVRIFIAEKGIDLQETPVDLRAREHKSEAHRARNSLGQVPTLVLDDGTTLSETVSICRYLEALNPAPNLFGATPLEEAQIDMWVRRIEFQLTIPAGMFWRHAHPLTARLLTQHKEFGESNRDLYNRAALWLDRELAGREWLAADRYTIADIAALTTVDFADWIGLKPPEEAANLRAWHARASARPSANA